MIVTDYIKDVVCTFSYGGGELNHKISFLVSDDLPFEMLLGMYYLEVAKPQFDWDKKVLKHKLPDGRTVRMTKFKASSVVDTYGCLCASAFYNYYKQNQEEGMYLVYVSEKREAVKTPPEIERVVAKFPDLFEEPTGVVDGEVVHAIEIIPRSKTLKGRIYRMAPAKLDELRKQLKELTEKGWIRPSTSPYGSPVLFVPKKGGTLRMCVDYRGLNAITVKNVEPLPRIDDLLDRVQGCKYYTKIDLKSGYHQIAIRPEDQHKTTFQTRYGLYEFGVMPFDLCNAPGTFQHTMNRIFHEHLDKFLVVYLDDILIFSKSAEEHAQHVETVLPLLRQHKYKVNLEKCEFGRTKILYLGHEVSAEGIRSEDAKVASIRDWPRPQTVTEVRSFLGMCGYYRNFVKNYSTIASPLTDLTRLDTPWDWSDECESAFKRLKHALMNHEVLMVPDPQKPFIVTTDASQYDIGAVLAQQDGKKLRPIDGEISSGEFSLATGADSVYQRVGGESPHHTGADQQVSGDFVRGKLWKTVCKYWRDQGLAAIAKASSPTEDCTSTDTGVGKVEDVIKAEGEPSTTTPPPPPLTPAQRPKREIQEKLREQQALLAEAERQEAAELEAATDASRKEHLMQQAQKTVADTRVTQCTRDLADLVLLQDKLTADHFTNWDERIQRLETRVADLGTQQSKILDAIQNLTAQLTAAKVISPLVPVVPTLKPKHPSQPPSPPLSSSGSPHSSRKASPTVSSQAKATPPPTFAAVVAGDNRGPKIPAPNKFKGDDPKIDVGDWTAGTRAYLKGFQCPEQQKVATGVGLLEGPAQKWATFTASAQNQTLEDWALALGADKLLQTLEDRFADKERVRKVADKIVRLGQQRYSGSLQALFAEFEQLTSTPGLVMSADDLLTNFCRVVPEKLCVALYSAGHKDWRSFGRAALAMEAKLHVQAPSSDKRRGAFPRGGRKGKAAFAYAGSGSASDTGSQPDAPSTPCPPEIQQVVDQYADLMQEPFGLPNRPTKHRIELLPGAVPPKGRIYRMSPAELEELRRQLETLTSKGWIRPHTSEFGALVLFVPKGSGEFRMCIDYRGLNKITRKSTESLPRIDGLLDMVQGCTIFSKVDLKSGYHQIEMAEEDVHKTAFKTRYVTHEYLVMPFELCSAPGTFQTEMHPIFRPYLDKFMVVCLDDILVFSKTTREHAEHLALPDDILWLKSQGELNDKLARYIQFIDLFDFEQKHKKGCYNKVADTLSRRPDSFALISSTHSFGEEVRHTIARLLPQDPTYGPTVGNLQADPNSEPGYALSSDLLYTYSRGEERFCIPEDQQLRTLLMSECHDARGHFGFLKSYAALSQRFFWKEMRSDMLRYVDTCELCQRNKVQCKPPSGLLKPLPIPDGPAQSVSIDFTDLVKTTPRGMRQVMVCVDRFSKYAPPTSIVSDRDPRFCSDEWQSYCKDYLHSRLDMTSGRHSPDQQDWDLHLVRSQLMYNMSVHSSTGFSPYRLHWGREPRQPLDDIIDKAKPDLTPGTAEFARRYPLDVERARTNLFKAQKAMIEQANRHRRPSPIRTGDYVWVASSESSREEDISPKLLPCYLGSWQVLNTVGADPFGPSYVIDVPLHLRTYPVFHASKLLPFIPADAFPDWPPQWGPPIPGKGYDVVAIEDEWGIGPDRQYLVRFAFQPPSENRWFYRRDLFKTAKSVVLRYEAAQKGNLRRSPRLHP
ncbi:hypothetical protein CBR_g54180 [Chara braunii]|uniref:Reverse transcriptase domain-containing protein n=1 Tax=Chara braunii TaxID=69332 RepID=A0A388K787_CHABU|nr:hypothetical protein CBR_g54180 [Chara braunii]|eukprot:GBG65889.1 hypothetical protein CBR_g54180 [Chara braunii]